MPRKWIQSAIKHPGAFTAKAKRAGMSVHDYALEKQHAPGTLGKQARLALTLERLHHNPDRLQDAVIVVRGKRVNGKAKYDSKQKRVRVFVPQKQTANPWWPFGKKSSAPKEKSKTPRITVKKMDRDLFYAYVRPRLREPFKSMSWEEYQADMRKRGKRASMWLGFADGEFGFGGSKQRATTLTRRWAKSR